jgi:ribosomal-protein-alanine N-acetyltransferase
LQEGVAILADDVKIRRARTDDVSAILALEALFPSDRLSARSVRQLLRSHSAVVLVAELDHKPVGNLILLIPRRWRAARIYSIVVAPEARGHGLARALVGAAEACAREAGKHLIKLEVRADNGAARALYTTLGYRCIAPKPSYYDDGADGECWAKSLQSV